MTQIKVQNLTVGYDGQAVTEPLDFCINSGDYLVILGENGAGKTTLMRTLLGLIPPLGGNVLFCGEGQGEKPKKRSNVCGEIGYLPQQTDVQRDFPASVWEVVLSGCQARCGLRPFYNHSEREEARAALERLGITHLKHKCYRELSGGQQQRVLLARALCATRKLLLLDEPVSGLDPIVTQEMYELVAGLNKSGVTIIMISHDVAAIKHASHVLHIGKEVFWGTKTDYLNSALGQRFLGKTAEAKNE